MKRQRRFGAHDVDEGKFTGRLHVSTPQYQSFVSELYYFHDHLNRRLLPTEPEEAAMLEILTNLQNLLEHEAEELIHHYATRDGTTREAQFDASIRSGYVTFKSKMDWLLARSLITQDQWDTMEEIRSLRNDYVHVRPTGRRRRRRYRGQPLLIQRSVRRMFVEVELGLRAMRVRSGRKSMWSTVPPGYATELHWPKEYIQALDGERPPSSL